MYWIFIGILLNKFGMLHGWTLFWFIVCIIVDCIKMTIKVGE